jgi:hypothetical protein
VHQFSECANVEAVKQADETIERLRLALELFAAGEEMQRQNLRRRCPGASEEEIEKHIQEWLRDRPGAELGGSAGTLRTRPREVR